MTAWRSCLVALAVVTAACSGDDDRTSPTTTARTSSPATTTATVTTTTTTAAAAVVVAVGASDAVGFGADDPDTQAWPRVLAGTAFPPESELVVLGFAGATVSEAIERLLPEAQRRRPTVAAVWLNVNDLVAGVPVDAYERRLGELVQALRDNGRTRVLVANTPALDVLPAYVECRSRGMCPGGHPPAPLAVRLAVSSYNAAIARVVERNGAVLVDLHRVGIEANRRGGAEALVAADGFHPSTAGHRVVAEAFAAAL